MLPVFLPRTNQRSSAINKGFSVSNTSAWESLNNLQKCFYSVIILKSWPRFLTRASHLKSVPRYFMKSLLTNMVHCGTKVLWWSCSEKNSLCSEKWTYLNRNIITYVFLLFALAHEKFKTKKHSSAIMDFANTW